MRRRTVPRLLSAPLAFCLRWLCPPQVDVKSFPDALINPLAANSEGMYIVVGGSSGNIYLWEVWSVGRGRLFRNIVFPTIIDAIALNPGDNVFFASGRDGKI
ncbi:hypothetical protein C1H46_034883 [Malus baccata]|uniref:Uncharacterized protein n=1 Tax=Malus baccata TaxID=106549 RepID=A0A540KZ67_MALBA|nr:hypothetical protein C1H46_034883 [Malus baccata]